jgi:starch phosphorylase
MARLARKGDHDGLWARHQRLKADLLDEIARRTNASLDPAVLTIGFARRAATYKRASLLLRDESWLSSLAAAKQVQFVFAGKAHPRDTGGQSLIAEIVAAMGQHPDTVVFMENYDMDLGAALTRGCDVWLNNPVRPKEASGTSGMKATANGVLNLSILDGWWDEGCDHGVNGWGVGAPPEGVDADDHDYHALRHLLMEVLLPTYQDRDRWTQMMGNAIVSATERFSAARLVRRYFDEMYLDGASPSSV